MSGAQERRCPPKLRGAATAWCFLPPPNLPQRALCKRQRWYLRTKSPFLTLRFFHYIVFESKVQGEKAYDDMLKIFKKVLEKNPEAKLNILGDGEERHSLGILADQLGIRKCWKYCW